MSSNGFESAFGKIIEGCELCAAEMEFIMLELIEGRLNDAQIAAFLTAMRIKGETVGEITASAAVLGIQAKRIDLKGIDCFDTCGTGGDGANTFNVSTATAFVLAAAGVKVAKHGNRSVSSKCGSADVLEKLGIRADMPPEFVRKCIYKTDLGFMFAPLFHEGLKHAAIARKSIGIRTIFNILGPLLNPAGARFRLLGVYKRALVAPLAIVLKNIGVMRAMVVHGEDGLDEISINEKTYVSELKEDKTIIEYTIDPAKYGLRRSDVSLIVGGTPELNAQIILSLFSGQRGAKRDMLLLNSAAALYIADKASTIGDGFAFAASLIDSGAVMSKLEELREFSRRCEYGA